MTKLYRNSSGLALAFTTGLTLTGAILTEFKVKKPSGDTAVWSATIDPADPTQLNYTSATGDFNEAGRYFLQAHVVLGTQDLYGETYEFDIFGPYA